MYVRQRARAEDGTSGVTVLWPDEHGRRPALIAAGRPLLLVVPDDAPPPTITGPLEDWIRAPIDPAELVVRLEELRRRHEARADGLRLDDDGLLHRGGRWVALTDGQQALMRPLLALVGHPVPLDEVIAAYAADGGRPHAPTVRRALSRLRGRLAAVGLDLHLLSGRAVLLAPTGDAGLFT